MGELCLVRVVGPGQAGGRTTTLAHQDWLAPSKFRSELLLGEEAELWAHSRILKPLPTPDGTVERLKSFLDLDRLQTSCVGSNVIFILVISQCPIGSESLYRCVCIAEDTKCDIWLPQN